MIQKPLVSIVMSVYNGKRYLSLSIESILNQTFDKFEFVIIDDGSRDSTFSILKRYASEDKRIRVFHQSNLGLTRSLIRGISMAQAEFIARMDCDDLSLPDRLKAETEFLLSHRSVGLVGTRYVFIDEEGEEIMVYPFPSTLATTDDLRRELFKRNVFAHGSVMFSKSIYQKIGRYRKEMRYGQDYDLWLRFSEQADIAMINKVLYKHRLNKDSVSIRRQKMQREIHRLTLKCAGLRAKGENDSEYVKQRAEEIYQEYGSLVLDDVTSRSLSLYFTGWGYLQSGKREKARSYLLRSLRYKQRPVTVRDLFLTLFPHQLYLCLKQIASLLKNRKKLQKDFRK